MVLYFTGTGNSRYLARCIAEGLEMPLYDLNACIKAGDTAPVHCRSVGDAALRPERRHNGVGSGVDVPSHAEHSRMFRRVVGDILLRHIIAGTAGSGFLNSSAVTAYTQQIIRMFGRTYRIEF